MNYDDNDNRSHPVRFVDSHLRREDATSNHPLEDAIDSMDPFLYGFIQFAPPEMSEKELQENPLFVAEHEISGPDTLYRAAVRWRYLEFKKSGDPVAAIESILSAIEHGVYPPVPVLKWLAKGLVAWCDEEGKIELGKALGLTSGKGATPPYKRVLLNERNDMLMLDMDRLIYLGATQEEAAAMVANRLAGEDWNKSRWEMADPDADTLKVLHGKNKNKSDLERSKATWSGSGGTVFPLDDPDWVRSYLSKFDSIYMPEKLKSRL